MMSKSQEFLSIIVILFEIIINSVSEARGLFYLFISFLLYTNLLIKKLQELPK